MVIENNKKKEKIIKMQRERGCVNPKARTTTTTRVIPRSLAFGRRQQLK